MKSFLSDETNFEATILKTGLFNLFFSNVNADEVQFIPLKSELEKAKPIRRTNREESNRCITNESYSSSADDSEIDYESSTSSIKEEKDACHLFGSNAVPIISRKIEKDKTRVIEHIDGTIFTKGRLRNEIRHRKECPNEVNPDKSICLVPALLDTVELMSQSTCKRKKDYSPNSLMTRTNQRDLDPTLPSSLQGRSEIYPRRSRVHQNQEFSFHKNFRRKHKEREMNEQLFTRVEKSSERLVRSIIVRNIESVRKIGATDPKLIVRIFEKYLSDVLDCNAKLLLGRKNLGLISHEDYLMDSSTRFPDPNFAYYFNIENPFSFLLYPSLVEGCAHTNKMSSQCGDEQNPGDGRVRCNCKQKDACCHCQAPKLPPTTDVQKKCSCMKDEKTCDCYKALQANQKMLTNPKPLSGLSEMKMSGGCACSQPMSVQKSIEQSLLQDDTCKMKPTASSLISGNDMRMKRRCECSKKNITMQTIGEGGASTKCCSCSKKSKKKRKSRSRSRSKSHASKSKSKKNKCDCTEICESKAPITAEGDHQPKKNSCECEPDLKIHEETARKPACSATKPDSPTKPRCPCPCRELMKMKTVKEGYISADPYGQKEDKRLCVCQPNSQPTQDESEGDNDQPPSNEAPCGICGVPEETNEGPHKCNICQLVEGLGTGPDESMSMSTFASSDFERIAGILKDTRDEILNQQNDDNKLISNIRCFRNSSGIICQSELVGCPGTCDKSGKSRTNTIEIRIKYPTRKTDKNKEKTCATTCTNTENARSSEKNRIEDENYCEFVKILQQNMSACFAKPAKSDLSMLLDSFARRGSAVCQITQCVRSDPKVNVDSDRDRTRAVPEKSDRKSSCLKTRASEDTRTCSLMQDPTLLCQTSTCEASSENEKKDVKCLYRRGKTMKPPPNGDDFTCPKRKSSDSLEAWALEEDKEEIQIGSCSKESCMRIVERPSYMVKKQRSVVECDVRGSCVRQKIFEKLFPNQKQPCGIPSKRSVPCEPPTRKMMPCELEPESPREDKRGSQTKSQQGRKRSIPTSKNSIKTKNVASKSSSKNIPQDKPPCSKDYLKPKRRDTMKLDRFDQNILAHALDTFLSKGR